jgi:hypothetical protein
MYDAREPFRTGPRSERRSGAVRDRSTGADRQPVGGAAGGAGRRAAGRGDRAVELPRPRCGDRVPQCHDGTAAGGDRPDRLSRAVALGSAGRMGAAVHAAGDGDRPDHPGDADHRGARPSDHRGPVARISRRADGDGRPPAAPRHHLDLGCAFQPDHRAAGGLRPRRGGGRCGDHRRRQHRGLHPHHDHGDRARDLQGRPAAGDRARHGADRDRPGGQRPCLGAAARLAG